MSPSDLDKMAQWKAAGLEAVEIHDKLCASRRRERRPEPDLTTTRRALRGKTFKRSVPEARGRKKTLSAKNLATMDRKRDELITKADSDYEVTWQDVVKASRVPSVHRTTAAKNMNKAGYNVKWRTPRQKPYRTDIDEAERKRKCNVLRKLPPSYWQRDVLLYMDSTRCKIREQPCRSVAW